MHDGPPRLIPPPSADPLTYPGGPDRRCDTPGLACDESRHARPDDMDASFMSSQPREGGIHAVWSGAGEGRGRKSVSGAWRGWWRGASGPRSAQAKAVLGSGDVVVAGSR